jgi:hypothetical protein
MTDIEKLEQFKDDLENIIALNKHISDDIIVQGLKETIEDFNLCKIVMYPIEFNPIKQQYEANFNRRLEK